MPDTREDKREQNRYSLRLPVQCSPMGSQKNLRAAIEIWTHDVHSQGAGLNWLISARPQICGTCDSIVRDLTCNQQGCPYTQFKDVLFDCGWVQIEGLNHVPGWENESKVLGKVVWFKLQEDGINFQFGVKFSKEKPPIIPSASSAQYPSAETSKQIADLKKHHGQP